MVVLSHRGKFWAYLGKFGPVLVHLLSSLHNPFQDMSVSNTNQTGSKTP